MYENPFQILGVREGADDAEVRKAYRAKVKTCHPDLYADPGEQKAAQDRLIRLNLAYEEALRYVSRKSPEVLSIPLQQALHFARRQLKQGSPQGALHQLSRSDHQDGEWYAVQGEAYTAMKRHEEAYQSYRMATRLCPDNLTYHRQALEAEMTLRKNQNFGKKISSWLEEKLRK